MEGQQPMTNEDLAQIRAVVREEKATTEARMRAESAAIAAAAAARILDRVPAEGSRRAAETAYHFAALTQSLDLLRSETHAIAPVLRTLEDRVTLHTRILTQTTPPTAPR
jgi:hypothetical protein